MELVSSLAQLLTSHAEQDFPFMPEKDVKSCVHDGNASPVIIEV